MMVSRPSVVKFIFGVSPEETTFARRGFRASDPAVQVHLERIGQIFLYGYHAALVHYHPERLEFFLSFIDLESRGFAYEGAAMGLSLLDRVTPWRRSRFDGFLNGPGAAHTYMAYTGMGWALGRLHRSLTKEIERLDPLMRWLVVDGYGFFKGYFHWCRYMGGSVHPRLPAGYAQRAFDQGLGRSLWFVEGGDTTRIPRTIAGFPPSRQADLWSGVGLACAYAGGADRGTIEALAAAGPYLPQLSQGAVFAAKARQRAGNPAVHTEVACQVFCGLSADAAASLADETLKDLPFDGPEPAYEVWRCRIQARSADLKGVTA